MLGSTHGISRYRVRIFDWEVVDRPEYAVAVPYALVEVRFLQSKIQRDGPEHIHTGFLQRGKCLQRGLPEPGYFVRPDVVRISVGCAGAIAFLPHVIELLQVTRIPSLCVLLAFRGVAPLSGKPGNFILTFDVVGK